jgi:saccharopine dehydrogenase-like NADP-dependent oxidoreductase
LQTIIKYASGKVTTYDEGTWTSRPGFERSIEVPLFTGGTAPAYEVDSAEPITFPREFPTIRAVRTYVSLQPLAFSDAIRQQGARIAEEGISPYDATIALLQEAEKDPERLLAVSDETLASGLFARASGVLDGGRAVVECTATSFWMTTHGVLAAAAKKLLSGELHERGVLSPESCLDPEPFFAEVLPYAEEPPPGGWLLQVKIERLD